MHWAVVSILVLGFALAAPASALAAPPQYYPPIEYVPAARSHIIGHNEVPGTDHSDPGPTWNWTYYMSLVRACSADRAQAAARAAVRTVDDQGFAPAAGLEVETVSDEVALLQWDLAY